MYQGSEEQKENARRVAKLGHARQSELKALREARYNIAPKVCKHCRCPLAYDKRANSFCSSACSASCNNTGRVVTDEQRKKTSKSLKKSVCFTELKAIEKAIKPVRQNLCVTCGKEFFPERPKIKNCSKACYLVFVKTPGQRLKSSTAAKKAMVEGKIKPWQSRLGKPPSYPERYFIDLFNKEGILFEREVKCGAFFIDFVIGKYAIEIDGSQHERPEIKEKDNRKTEFLIENGYEVIRIKWYNPAFKNRHLLHSQIETLLSKIKTFRL